MSDEAPLQDEIVKACNDIADMLFLKNTEYAVEQIKVRIDDKLSRTARKPNNLEEDEDLIADMIGYFILLKIAVEREGGKNV